MAPAYLAADCRLLSEEGPAFCVVRKRYFVTAGPSLWNSLPAGLRQMDIGYEQFKQLLKTYLFGH